MTYSLTSYTHAQLHIAQRGSGQPVIFVHGGEEAGGATAFAAQAPLAEAYTLVMPDLPGHGHSPAQGRVSADRDALLIADLFDRPVHLVGHSYGGAVALKAAVRRPDKVKSLMLVEPATLDIGINDPDVRQMVLELAQAVAVPDLRERLQGFASVIGIHKTWRDPLSETDRTLAEELPVILSLSGTASGTTTASFTSVSGPNRSGRHSDAGYFRRPSSRMGTFV